MMWGAGRSPAKAPQPNHTVNGNDVCEQASQASAELLGNACSGDRHEFIFLFSALIR